MALATRFTRSTCAGACSFRHFFQQSKPFVRSLFEVEKRKSRTQHISLIAMHILWIAMLAVMSPRKFIRHKNPIG